MTVKLEVLGLCKSCRHWLAICKHGWEVGTYCDDGCADRVAAVPRLGTCKRALSGGASYANDENGKYDTRPDFGCVMWEGKG